MIKPAREVREEMMQTEEYKAAMAEEVSHVTQSIELAKSRGRTHADFSVRARYRDEVKRLFLDAGYTFRPTGYVGGVWQLSEDICW